MSSAAPSRSFGSVGVAMVTPFTPSGEVDYDAARALAVSLVDDGADLILLSGTTGESPTTHTPEKQELIRQVKDALAGRAMIMAGAGSNDTAHAVRIGVASQEAGAEGLLINAPYYNRPSQEGVYQHINAVVEATDLPVMVYDIPGRTGVKITEETLARLAENPRVKAVKDATGDVEQGFRRMESTGLEYYSGDDGLNFAWLTHGASGVISVAAHADAQQRDEEAGQARGGRDGQGAEREPGDDAQHAADHQGPGHATEHLPQHATEHQRDDEQHRPALPEAVVGGCRAAPRGRRQGLAIEDAHDLIQPCSEASIEVALPESGRDDLRDDPRSCRVVQCAFDPVADLDPYGAVVLGNEQQRAVVDLAAAQLPLLDHTQREGFDRLRPRRRHDQHRYLRALALLERAQRLLERGALLCRQRAGQVGHPTLQRRHRDEVLGGRAECGRAQEPEDGEPAQEASDRDAGCCHFLAPEAPMPPRSTFGGTASAASSVTLKLALTP